MALEIYVSPVKASKPQVKITYRGTIIFNVGARNKFDLDDFTHVALYFDRDERKIFVNRVQGAEAEGALQLRKLTNTAEVAGQGFKKFFDINYAGTKLYDLEEVEVQGVSLIQIDLTKGREEVTPRKNLRKENKIVEPPV